MSKPGNTPRVSLKVIGQGPTGYELSDTIPATRGDCKDGPRPCSSWRCSMFLGTVDRLSRPGRRHANGGGPGLLVDLRRIHIASCALDVVDANPEGLSTTRIAALLGLKSHRRIEQMIAVASGKVQLAAARDAGLADELGADREPLKVRSIQPEVRPLGMQPPKPVASIRLTVEVGSRTVEVTAKGGDAAAVLGALRASGSSLARAVYLELRTAMTEAAA